MSANDSDTSNTFEPSSVASVASSFVDVWISYHRSQTFLTASSGPFPTARALPHPEDGPLLENSPSSQSYVANSLETRRTATNGTNLRDHDDHTSPVVSSNTLALPQTSASSQAIAIASNLAAESNRGGEGTPLLRHVPSVSFDRQPESGILGQCKQLHSKAVNSGALQAPKSSSQHEPNETKQAFAGGDAIVDAMQSRGTSTFGQTLFNSISILVGIGMLSEPLAFSYVGWTGGALLLILYAFVACYTARLLAGIMFSDSRVQSYADIGRKAFGPQSVPLINTLFCLELFSLSVVLVTLFADSLHAVMPAFSTVTYKVLSLVVIIPTALLPLSLLAYASVIGILASILIIFVIFYDGLTKMAPPGSLYQPCETRMLGNLDFRKFGMSFGLFMAGFSGHAVVPSLARDMKRPELFGKMINWAFVVSTLIYAIVGAAGYIMFGDSVSDEVSQDLLRTEGYNPYLNQLLMWMLAVMPISKFALGTRPLNNIVESVLGIGTDPSGNKKIVKVIIRATIAALSVSVSIIIPEFSTVMAFLGSFSAFIICIIGPIAAHITLHGATRSDMFILTTAVVMAGWGTAAAFL